MTKEYASAWAQAFFDGEGTCFFRYKPELKKNSVRKGIVGTSTDKELIDKCSECLDVLGIGYRVLPLKAQRNGCLPQWRIGIQVGDDILKYADSVGFHSYRKRATLVQICAWVRRHDRPQQFKLALALPDGRRGGA